MKARTAIQSYVCRLFGTFLLLAFLLSTIPVAEAANTKESGQSPKLKGDTVVATANKYKGVPYLFGGASPKGFDCSGFLMYVFDQHGVKLPRTADKQYEKGKFVARKDLQIGDLVFFTTYEKGASHCGIYVGKDSFIHASSSMGVTVTPLSNVYWKGRYLGARRVLP